MPDVDVSGRDAGEATVALGVKGRGEAASGPAGRTGAFKAAVGLTAG